MIPQRWASEGFRIPFLPLPSAARDLSSPGGPSLHSPEPMWLVSLGRNGSQVTGGRSSQSIFMHKPLSFPLSRPQGTSFQEGDTFARIHLGSLFHVLGNIASELSSYNNQRLLSHRYLLDYDQQDTCIIRQQL